MNHDLDGAFHIDLETRSRINLRACGPFVYGEDWSTEVWVACFARGDEEPDHWYPGMPVPPVYLQALEDRAPFVAHNVGFERALILTNLSKRHGWPAVPLEHWYCTASLAAAMSLPRTLEGANRVLGIAQKDMAGNDLIKKMMKPYKEERIACRQCGAPKTVVCACGEQYRLKLYYVDDPISVFRGTMYCKQDVRAERELAKRVRSLTPTERQVWLLDQRINERGVCVDRPLVEKALAIVRPAVEELNLDMRALTGAEPDLATGKIIGGYKASQVSMLRWWLLKEGINLADLRKETVRDLLAEGSVSERARYCLELRQEAAKTSTAKLNAYLNRTCADGNMRDNLMYWGATTGRWSGRGAQLQNLPSRYILTQDQIELAIGLIQAGATSDDLRCWIDTPLEVLSACLRSMIMAPPGEEIIACDYNAIEARVIAWLADAPVMLNLFRSGGDPYLYMASEIYHIPFEQMNKGTHKAERALGKKAVLGLGYQMGWKKFIESCAADRIIISEADAVRTVTTYRTVNLEIKELWDELNDAAIRAVANPGTVYECAGGKLAFQRLGSWLYMKLPSGRLLSYPQPSIEWQEVPWFDERTGHKARRPAVIYYGIDQKTHKWSKQTGYGGKWAENATQAVARDLLAEAMLRLEAAQYRLIVTVHDETVSTAPKGFRSEFDYIDGDGHIRPGECETIMCELPAWAAGLPVAAEGWRGPRYRK
ncbi:MAG: hypothetical protein KGL39_03465 [Patescibacteria group bacterium]|nr:hypothetical protein [Patescibacteria group bacterium]